jgi:hypothetical protein
MKNCPNCSKKVRNDAILCPHCGKAIELIAVEPAPDGQAAGAEVVRSRRSWALPVIIVGCVIVLVIMVIIGMQINQAQVAKREATAAAVRSATEMKANELATQSADLMTQTAYVPTQTKLMAEATSTAYARAVATATQKYLNTQLAGEANLERANLAASKKMPSLGAVVQTLKFYSYIGVMNNGSFEKTALRYGTVFKANEMDGICAMLTIRFTSSQRKGVLYYEYLRPDLVIVKDDSFFDVDKSWWGAYLTSCISDRDLIVGDYIVSIYDKDVKVAKGMFTIK